ncbi:MAG: ABC transporter permease [Planctomycetota bacterium]|nr:ABC transporter permease [Planctomycetota bacterium]
MSEAWRRFKKDKVAVTGAVVILAISLAAALAPFIAPYDPYELYFEGLSLQGAPRPPDGEFWLGTDTLGRDLFSRLLYGARTSLIIGIAANAAAVFIGTALGATAGYVGGWVGIAIMRFTDLMMAFPALLLAIALAAILTPSLWIVVMVIALVNWVQTSRVMYTQTRSLVEQEFIVAARSLGAAWPRILLVHILPHLVPHILVWATLGISVTVLLEATLSFLGIGVQPPTASWGGIINESQTFFLTAPWLVFFPGISILVVALAFNVVGDGLRDALDPTQRGRE